MRLGREAADLVHERLVPCPVHEHHTPALDRRGGGEQARFFAVFWGLCAHDVVRRTLLELIYHGEAVRLGLDAYRTGGCVAVFRDVLRNEAQQVGELHVHLLGVRDVQVAADLACGDDARRVVARLVRVGGVEEEDHRLAVVQALELVCRDVSEPLALDDVASGDGRPLLVEGRERPGAAPLGVREPCERVPILPQRLADLPGVFGQGQVLADGRDAHHRPLVALTVEEPPSEVVLVPARHNEYLLAAVVQTGQEHVRVPLPVAVSVGLRTRLDGVLHGVVDDAQVYGRTCKRSAHAHSLVEASVTHGLE